MHLHPVHVHRYHSTDLKKLHCIILVTATAPCCGSGGMFVQSERFVEDREGRIDGRLAIYGQKSNYNTWKLCKMNLTIRGIEANLGQQNADSFHNDQHKSLKADYIMANPPFNISDWGGERLTDDPRWSKYGIPPTGNANYAWILHMLYHLAPSGIAGFVLANGSLSSSTISEYNIRKNLIEDDKIDCIVTLQGGLFSTTSIPVCLWFVARNKLKSGHRDRHGEILFIDARNMETEPYEDSRTQKQLTAKTIDEITSAYHSFRNHEKKTIKADGTEIKYADKQGFWKIATLEEIREKDYNLTSASYIDKPMSGHNLMQAIARVNRVFKDKPGGLTVDYIGIADNLRNALAQYTPSDRKTTGIDPQVATDFMLEKYEQIQGILHGLDYSSYIDGSASERMACIVSGLDFVLGKSESEKKNFLNWSWKSVRHTHYVPPLNRLRRSM